MATARRSTAWRPIPWWLAIPFAIVFTGLAFVVGATASGPLRPDVGYVVSQPDICHIGVAADAAADRPDLTISSKSGGTCTRWDKGTRLYYDADAPRAEPGRTAGTSNTTWGIAIFVALAAICVVSAAYDLVLRRRRVAARGRQDTDLTVRPPSSGRTYDRVSTVEDLVSVALDPTTGRVELGPSDRALGSALLLDLGRAGAIRIIGRSGAERVEIDPSAQLEDPTLRAAQQRLRSHGLENEQPQNRRERLFVGWLERRNTKPLTLGEARSRLSGEHLDAPVGEVQREVLERVTASGALEGSEHRIQRVGDSRGSAASQPAPRDELLNELRAVLRGVQAPDERTGPLIAVLEVTGRLDTLGIKPQIDPGAVLEGEWADATVRAIIAGIRAAPQGS